MVKGQAVSQPREEAKMVRYLLISSSKVHIILHSSLLLTITSN